MQTKDMNKAREIAARMRTDNAYINYPTPDAGLPFGGYNAEYGLEDFLEIKGIARLRSGGVGATPSGSATSRSRGKR
nr:MULTISPECIES: hypothetical protein [unclassified Mesorhizobium]